MPVFISYSHADKTFVDKMSAHLVKNNAHVWVDTWELNVGDSILNRVQDAIQESSALLVVLSKASVASEWCKKELSAGLMRELDEKRVVVLPVLIEDCEIPVFLREKMYADFRINFDLGISTLIDGIAKVTNSDQGRIFEEHGTVDWSVDWGYRDGLFELHFTLVESSPNMPMTILTEVFVLCNDVVTKRHEQFVNAGVDWMGRLVLTEALVDIANEDDFRVILDSQFPQIMNSKLIDEKRKAEYTINVKCRRLGQDNGKDQLVNISRYLIDIRDYMREISRPPTKEELKSFVEVTSTPFGA